MQSAATSAVGVHPAAAHIAVLWSHSRTCMVQPRRQVCTEVTTCALKAVHLLQQQTINCCISKHTARKSPASTPGQSILSCRRREVQHCSTSPSAAACGYSMQHCSTMQPCSKLPAAEAG